MMSFFIARRECQRHSLMYVSVAVSGSTRVLRCTCTMICPVPVRPSVDTINFSVKRIGTAVA